MFWAWEERKVHLVVLGRRDPLEGPEHHRDNVDCECWVRGDGGVAARGLPESWEPAGGDGESRPGTQVLPEERKGHSQARAGGPVLPSGLREWQAEESDQEGLGMCGHSLAENQ